MSRARNINSVVDASGIHEIICQLDLVRVAVKGPETAPRRCRYGDGSFLADICEFAVESGLAAYDKFYTRAGTGARVKVAERCEDNFADSPPVD